MPGLHEPGPLLDLSWTCDERELLDVDIEELVRRVLVEESRTMAATRSYPVTDPYGARAAISSLRAFLHLECGDVDVVAGSGVGGLLHDLAALAAGSDLALASPVYPNLPAWARGWRARIVAADTRVREGVFFLERPAVVGDDWHDLAQVRELCDRAIADGNIVLIDESNANYEPPHYSAASLVAPGRPLIVLRGLTKAYGLGGLRAGWAIFPPELRDRVHSVATPLAMAPLIARAASAVLDQGDVTSVLRAAVAQRREWSLLRLRSAGVLDFQAASSNLPYLISETPTAAAHLLQLGIRSKRHLAVTAEGVSHLTRMSVPLRPDRVSGFRACTHG